MFGDGSWLGAERGLAGEVGTSGAGRRAAGPAPVIPASAGMMTRLVSRVKNRAVDRPSAVTW